MKDEVNAEGSPRTGCHFLQFLSAMPSQVGRKTGAYRERLLQNIAAGSFATTLGISWWPSPSSVRLQMPARPFCGFLKECHKVAPACVL